MKPNPIYERFDDRPSARPTIAQIAGAFLCAGGLIAVLYAAAFVVMKFCR